MSEEIVNFNHVEDRIITLRGVQVITDSDVAELYSVETRVINQAVKNNPEKFPGEEYVFELSLEEKEEMIKIIDQRFLRSKILILENNGRGKHSKYLPKVFTEKGLYMLATILKSTKATQTTLAIIEAFAKIRELTRTVIQLSESQDESLQKSLMQKSGDIVADLFSDDIKTSDTETSIELNLAVLKFKHVIRRKKE